MSYTYQQRRSGTRSGRSPKSRNPFITFLFYLIPFVLFNGCILFLVISKPKLAVTVGDSHDYVTSVATIKVKSLIPTTSLSASMDSEEIVLEKSGRKEYTATIMKNGILEITAKSINGTFTTEFEQISSLDDNPPSITNNVIESGILTITMEDSQSGIDYDSLTATDSAGSSQKPLSIDKSNATATFKMDSAGLNILVKDLAGHLVQMHYTSTVEKAEDTKETEKASDKKSSTDTTKAKSNTNTTKAKNSTVKTDTLTEKAQ